MVKHNFKVGDFIEVIECDTFTQWDKWKETIGHKEKLNGTQIGTLDQFGYVILANNKYGINFPIESLRKVPKFWEE